MDLLRLRARLTAGVVLLLAAGACAVTIGGGGGDSDAATATGGAQSVALSSWNDGAAKTTIIDFVERVTRQGSPDYVEPRHRVATFDNDGTLWAEKPLYFEFAFVYERIRALAPQNPGWTTQGPFNKVLGNDDVFPPGIVVDDFQPLLIAAMTGMTEAEFDAQTQAFFATARHPRFDRSYAELVYEPMVELLDYLRAHDFDVHIVSGGTVEFMRAYADEAYGVPPQNVVGSSFAYEFRDTTGVPEIFRQPNLAVFNDSAAKPVNIQLHIGKRPILAFGNSNGDIQMLEFATGGTRTGLALLLHHDDAEREYAYDQGAEQALRTAAANGWTVVSIKDDFTTVFPPATSRR
jgi:phosphoserine phosphatase